MLTACCVVVFAFAGPPKVTVGKETTYIAGPLRADGTVDYVAGYNALAKDIAPAENAAVPIARAIGMRATKPGLTAEYFKLLGCEPPEDRNRLIEFVAFLRERGEKASDSELDDVERFMREPWPRKSHPRVAAWLERNREALDLFVEASRRPKFFAPCLLDREPPSLQCWKLDLVQEARSGVRLLLIRAMARLHEKNATGALDDLDVCYRLGRLVGGGRRFLIEGLVGGAFQSLAIQAERHVAFSGLLDKDATRARMERVGTLGHVIDVADAVDGPERLVMLSATYYALVGDAEEAFQDRTFGRGLKYLKSFDYDADEVLRTINRYFDRLAAAARTPDYIKSTHEVGRVLDDLQRWKKEFEGDVRTALLFAGNRQHSKGRAGALGQRWGEYILLNQTPSLLAMYGAIFKSQARQRQTVLAYALADFRRARGSYPERLDANELGVPGDAVVDPFNLKPFVYRLEKGKRQVVSVGSNGKLDQPQTPKFDDVVMELP